MYLHHRLPHDFLTHIAAGAFAEPLKDSLGVLGLLDHIPKFLLKSLLRHLGGLDNVLQLLLKVRVVLGSNLDGMMLGTT